MIEVQEKPLKILSASAGSGKTYNLVLTYLKLILNEQEHPEIFSSIIAMTFTNKAASEMKSRIIDALNLLSSKDPNNQKASKFLDEISEKLKLPKDKIKFRSALVLKHILHQYENFSVLTIDKFNLRLIRSFSRDLNINNDFQTTTNEQEILSQLVDQIFSEINDENQKNLTEIALKLSHERFEEEGKWDFKKDLNEFVSILLKEQNLTIIESILQQDFSLNRYEELKANLRKIKKEIQEKASELHRICFSYDTNNFPGGSTTVKALEKLNDIFNPKSKNEVYFSNTIYNAFLEDPKSKAFPEEIKQKGLEFSHFYRENSVYVEQLSKFLSQYFFIAIIQIIAKELQNFKKSENIVLISEFNKLISDLLKDEYAPYIYERIGNRYKHFLLDEFQDTSRLQWINLIPLIHESLSKEQVNLIVGDPKQSIYRFKNGLAEQFVSLPKIYNPENDSKLSESSHFFDQMGTLEPLTENWRSKKEIVSFNNAFFQVFKELYPDVIGQFYTDIKQNSKANEGGYIYFESALNSSQAENNSFDEEEDEILASEFPFLKKWIDECIEAGYDYGDICILDYKKSDCNAYAKYLSSFGLKVVSTDSLLLGADNQVKLLIQFIKWRNNPSSEGEARKFAEMYFDFKDKNAFEHLKKYWKKISLEEKREFYIFDSSAFLKDEFQGDENFFFHFENLYQLIQKAYVLFGFDEFSSPYLHQFSDYVFVFDQNFGPELNLFIEFYEKDGHKTPVVIPENKEAIKIMTSHKSKGLEFPIVMIPSLKWEILMSQSKFLIEDDKFIYYTSLSKDSSINAIKNKYLSEYNQATLDKVNLNYVMFTRPEERLYVRNVSENKGKEYEKIVHTVLKELTGEENEKIVYELGEKSPKQQKEQVEIEDSKFFPQRTKDNLWFPEISLQNNDLLGKDSISEERRFGNQLHEVLALTLDFKELDKIIQELLLKGKIEVQFEQKIKDQAHKILNFSDYLNLFEGATEILREQDIILSENESKRPDIILIKNTETIILDYKTGKEENKYAKQLASYCKTLADMGFPNVKGLILYTNSLKLVTC